MVIAILDCLNECNFAVEFHDKTKVEQVKELMRAGLQAWYNAADIEENHLDPYFTAEDIQSFFDVGYTEPTMELLERYGVDAEIIDIQYDKNDEVINADEVIYY